MWKFKWDFFLWFSNSLKLCKEKLIYKLKIFYNFRYSRRNRAENEGVRKGPPDLRTGHIGSRLRSPSGRVKWSFRCFKFFWSRVLIEFSSVIPLSNANTFMCYCKENIDEMLHATVYYDFGCFRTTAAFVDPTGENNALKWSKHVLLRAIWRHCHLL